MVLTEPTGASAVLYTCILTQLLPAHVATFSFFLGNSKPGGVFQIGFIEMKKPVMATRVYAKGRNRTDGEAAGRYRVQEAKGQGQNTSQGTVLIPVTVKAG